MDEVLTLDELSVMMQCDGWDAPCTSQDGKRIRMNTCYQNEEGNYRVLCPECHEECRKYWDEMWKIYYQERL
jgi:hypothetical protein